MTATLVGTPWIVRTRPSPRARLRLFCFSYAGGGASMYRAWPTRLPEAIEVCAIQLPGREYRIREPLFNRVQPLIAALQQAIEPYLDLPFAFFGHSLGALISFELARALRRRLGIVPVQMLVSARLAPQCVDPHPPCYHLPDHQFIDELRRLEGTSDQVFQNPDLMRLVLPILRADFALNETYTYVDQPALDCPISAFGGTLDPKANRADLENWQVQTARRFTLRMLAGNHFFVNAAPPALFQAITDDLLPHVHATNEINAYVRL